MHKSTLITFKKHKKTYKITLKKNCDNGDFHVPENSSSEASHNLKKCWGLI